MPPARRRWLARFAVFLGGLCFALTAVSAAPEDGVLDLRNWQFETSEPIALNGEWHFYNGKLLSDLPTDSTPQRVTVPDIWNALSRDDMRQGKGSGTYALRVLLPANCPELGIDIPTISSAFTLLANGKSVASAGIVGSNAASTEPAFRPQVVALPGGSAEVQLLLQVSNYHHARGGLWDVLQLGRFEVLKSQFDNDLQVALFLASASLLLGMYHVMIWSQRRHDVSPLVFAGLCLSLGVRTLCTEEIYLLQVFPNIPFDLELRLEYLSIITLVSLGMLFVAVIFPRDFNRRLLMVLEAPLILYAALVLVTPMSVFTAGLAFFHALVVVIVLSNLYVVTLALIRRRDGAILYAFSITAVALFMLHSVFTTVVPTAKGLEALAGSAYLLPVGFIGVLFTQAMVLARRSTTAMQALERQTAELSAAHERADLYAQSLEQRVAERTAELEQANSKLEQLARIDGLTGLPNRRHFDERLADTWSDHTRGGQALSLVLIDVDRFKQYNDHYGHVQGDETLKDIASALRDAVHRPTDLVARYGGEEIVALLPNTDLKGAKAIAERMRASIESLDIAHAASEPGRLTVSVGIASGVPDSDQGPAVWIQRADQAMYRAKSEGRNRVAF